MGKLSGLVESTDHNMPKLNDYYRERKLIPLADETMAPALPGWHCPAPLTMSEQKDLQKQHQKDQQAIKRLQAGNPLEKTELAEAAALV